MTDELSEYATIVPCGETWWVFLIMAKRLLSLAAPSMVQEALNILCRQCSELAWANIINSTSVGSRAIRWK